MEVRVSCSASLFTSVSSASTLAVSDAMVFACSALVASRSASIARSSSISEAGCTTNVDHVRDRLSIVNFEARGMITLWGGVNGYGRKPDEPLRLLGAAPRGSETRSSCADPIHIEHHRAGW